jgi:uncharacterized RmlC-like cupin family protein
MDAKVKPTCKVISSSGASTYDGKQGFTYFSGISAESAGSSAICMHLLTIPPGGRAKAHMHRSHETTIYQISGEGGFWHGDRLENYSACRPGDFIYIPAGVPHLPHNPSKAEPCVVVIARADPNEQESVILLPELEALAVLKA